MAEPFDPYHVWLGIPPGERPVSHYRLLAIEPFESNPEVIENAVDQRTMLLRTFQLAKYSGLSQKLLNEVAAAKICLLRPEKKAAYDEQLRQQLQAKSEGSVSERSAIDSQLAGVLELEGRKGRGQTRPAPIFGRGAVFGAAGAVATLVVIVVVWAAMRKAALPVAAAPERDSRPVALAGTSSVPPPADQKAVAPEADKEPRRHKDAEGSLDGSAAQVPVHKRGAAESPLPDTRHAPPPAIAPFDAEKAKQHQEAWAKYLGVPVEWKNSLGMPLVLIPPGEFDMGATSEEIAWAQEQGKKNQETAWYFDRVLSEAPRHRVKLTKPFYLGVYHVTQREYEKVMGVNPSAFTWRQRDGSAFEPPLLEGETKSRRVDATMVANKDTGRYPVETVSWDDVMEFCRRLSLLPAERATKGAYRLPTEAEWEYACRAGTTTRWYCGDDEGGLIECAWFIKNAAGMTHPVGEKKPNAWGLYDMHGNVWQWCADWFNAAYYKQLSLSEPAGPPAGSIRVLRGGCRNNSSFCRSAFRNSSGPTNRFQNFGFRVVVER
jgi:formylglycine-generating enzyme required for sulfatase activity